MWLLEPGLLNELRQAYKNFSPTNLQIENFEARFSGSPENRVQRIYSVENGVAKINVSGTLTDRPNIFAEIFGGGNVIYADIIAAFVNAENDDSVRSVDLNLSSGGGKSSGLFETMDAMQVFSKPINAYIHGMAASAAFGLVSQADKIIATNSSNQIGSVGVAVQIFVDDDVVNLTSTNAPKKRPDLKTEEGQAIVVNLLDAIHENFVTRIAAGRNISVEKINSDFGEGATFLADEALKRGMIDEISSVSSLKINNDVKPQTATGGLHSEALMDLKTLETEHADLYQAVLEKGVAKGITQERGRVKSHLKLGKSANATDLALGFIEDGAEVTQDIFAEYGAAQLNNLDIASRAADDNNAGDQSSSNNPGNQDATLGLLYEKLGLEVRQNG